MTEDSTNGRKFGPVVVQARSETTAKCMESMPFDTRTLQCIFNSLRAERRQVQREDTRTFEDPCCVGVLFSVLLEFRGHVRQQMNGSRSVFGLRVDNLLVPHSMLHRQSVAVNVFPLQAAKFSKR